MATMRDPTALMMIKTVHTIIWLAFNVVLFYLCYAVIIIKIDQWVWIGIGPILAEGMVLLAFQIRCPLTLIAGKYSSSTKSNFDIYLPECWQKTPN